MANDWATRQFSLAMDVRELEIILERLEEQADGSNSLYEARVALRRALEQLAQYVKELA